MANSVHNAKIKEQANACKVITGVTRLSYANLNQPKSINGGDPRYSVSVLIPKSDAKTLAKINAAVEAAYSEGAAKLKGNGKSIPALAALKTPLRDGDVERPDDPAYQGHFFLNANNKEKPGIVDINRDPIFDPSEIYSGIYARCSLSFFAFNSSGNRGIAVAINNVQKVRDGEPLGSRTKAEDDFNDDFTDDGEDDFLN
jgi:hypothetical protein